MSTPAMPIDTQKIGDKLTAAGIPRDHAGAIASVFADTAENQHAFNAETPCTKHDLDQAFSGLERRRMYWQSGLMVSRRGWPPKKIWRICELKS